MYKVKYGCSNCGQKSEIEFPIGEKAPNKIICPHCGNYTAVKQW